MALYIICAVVVLAALAAAAAIGAVCVSLQRTHEEIHNRNRDVWNQGEKLFMPFDIWTSH